MSLNKIIEWIIDSGDMVSEAIVLKALDLSIDDSPAGKVKSFCFEVASLILMFQLVTLLLTAVGVHGIIELVKNSKNFLK